MRWVVIVVILVFMLIYAVIGGVIFHFIESKHEDNMEPTLRERVQAFVAAHPCVNLTRLLKFKILMRRADAAGIQVSPKTQQIFNITNWDVPNSIFFASQLIGAVGYGVMTPQTTGGKIFTVFFTLIGIPLFIVFAFGVGRPIAKLARYLERRMCGSWMLHERALEPQPVPQNKSEKKAIKRLGKLRKFWVYFLRIAILFVIGSIFFVLIPAIIFDAIEPWNYAESVYYCYTTVLTVGFGDYIAGDAMQSTYRGLYRIATSCYVYIGVAFFVVVFYPLQETLNFRKAVNTPLSFRKSGVGDEQTDEEILARKSGFRFGWGSTGRMRRKTAPEEFQGAYAGPPRVGASPYVGHGTYGQATRHSWGPQTTGQAAYGDQRYALSGEGLKPAQPGANRVAQGKLTSLVVNSP